MAGCPYVAFTEAKMLYVRLNGRDTSYLSALQLGLESDASIKRTAAPALGKPGAATR
jgi:hypothetical protein